MSNSHIKEMTVLCLDSSARRLKTGLFTDRCCLAESCAADAGNHSEKIILEIEKLLTQAKRNLTDLDLLAVNLGPGSFTGLRIGLAAMAGLGLANDLPVVGFNAFELMAEDLKNERGLFRALIHSRGCEYYCAELRGDGAACRPEGNYTIISILDPGAVMENATLIGSGAREFFDKLPEHGRTRCVLHPRADLPTLSALASCALSLFAAGKAVRGIIPDLFYLSPSQAEIAYALRNKRHN